METIGKRIRNARKRLHLTQEALAVAIGKNPNLLARWERGEVKMRAEVLTDIARVLEEINESYLELSHYCEKRMRWY